ncbi:MAG: HEAT repeat domain-containing protein, partial [Acidobacteriota bacterium]
MDLIAMLRLSREEFTSATRRSAIGRARYAGLLRNVAVALGNAGDPEAGPALIEALAHPEPLVRGHAAWALAHLGLGKARRPLTERLRWEENPDVRDELQWALSQLDGPPSP